jgi:N-acetylmuramic acid 6-phosphate etherase
MAVAGSTRMQATTLELLVVGAALETALVQILSRNLDGGELESLDAVARPAVAYSELFAALIKEMCGADAVAAIARATEFERDLYRQKGLVTYLADTFLLDILTDTTERSPTFSLPPFRRNDDVISPPSWAFVKDPLLATEEAWQDMLQRPPRGLAWDGVAYRRLNAPDVLQHNPPRLDNAEIVKFEIGSEPDPARWAAAQTALVAVLVGQEAVALTSAGHPFQAAFKRWSANFCRTAAICVGPHGGQPDVGALFHVPCSLPASPLALWDHLAVKLALNTLSTATMALMGRVVGNWMVHVQASNKKLIDRSTRLIAGLTGLGYEEACVALYEAMDEIALIEPGQERPSPAALAVERIGRQSSAS